MIPKVLLIAAPVLLLAASGLWLAAGANRGWTKTSVPITRTDEVTGITVEDYQKGFIPGIDFLAVALVGSGVLAGAGVFLRRPQSSA